MKRRCSWKVETMVQHPFQNRIERHFHIFSNFFHFLPAHVRPSSSWLTFSVPVFSTDTHSCHILSLYIGKACNGILSLLSLIFSPILLRSWHTLICSFYRVAISRYLPIFHAYVMKSKKLENPIYIACSGKQNEKLIRSTA